MPAPCESTPLPRDDAARSADPERRAVDKRVPARGHGHGRNETHTPSASQVTNRSDRLVSAPSWLRLLFNTNTQYKNTQ